MMAGESLGTSCIPCTCTCIYTCIYTCTYTCISTSADVTTPFVQDLASHLFGNPHSQHGWSGNEGSAQAVAEARHLTLQMCNAPLGEYECVFTSGATGALHSADPFLIIATMLIRILGHERFVSWSELLLNVDLKGPVWTLIHCAAKLHGLQLSKHITMWQSSFFEWFMEYAYHDFADELDLFVEAVFGKKGSQSFAKFEAHQTQSQRHSMAKRFTASHTTAEASQLIAEAFIWQESS